MAVCHIKLGSEWKDSDGIWDTRSALKKMSNRLMLTLMGRRGEH